MLSYYNGNTPPHTNGYNTSRYILRRNPSDVLVITITNNNVIILIIYFFLIKFNNN